MGRSTKVSVTSCFSVFLSQYSFTNKHNIITYIHLRTCLFLSSDIEDDDEGEKEGGDDDEDFDGPMPGDDGMGPLAARKFFEEKKKELGGSLTKLESQDEGEEHQSSHYKIVQWNHRIIRELYRTIQVLRQKREDLSARVKEQLQRKGLA
jgi:hypothetical protein